MFEELQELFHKMLKMLWIVHMKHPYNGLNSKQEQSNNAN